MMAQLVNRCHKGRNDGVVGHLPHIECHLFLHLKENVGSTTSSHLNNRADLLDRVLLSAVPDDCVVSKPPGRPGAGGENGGSMTVEQRDVWLNEDNFLSAATASYVHCICVWLLRDHVISARKLEEVEATDHTRQKWTARGCEGRLRVAVVV